MIALLMLAAHMFGDLVLQTREQGKYKLFIRRLRAEHVSTYSLCFLPVGAYAFGPDYLRIFVFLLLIWTTHWTIDSFDFKRWPGAEHWGPKPILVDQAFHVLTLALIGIACGL